MKAKAIIGIMLLLLAALGVLAGLYVQQGSAMRELETEAAVLAQRSAALEEFFSLAEDVPLGYANESFRASKSVIVMKSGESGELKLTANWTGGGQVFVDCSSDAAELSFTEEDWEIYTTMKVKALHPGVTVARFGSDATDKTFAVCIFVE